MKKTIVLLIALLLILLPLEASGSEPPDWTQSAHRQENYPAQDWYTGFAFDQLKPGANVTTAIEALKKNALNEMSERIIVTVKSTTDMTTTRQQRQSGTSNIEEITKDYRQALQTATTATTVKTEVLSYHNTATGEIYAFAAVRRTDLANFYRRQLNVDLSKAETAVAVSEQLIEAGKKISAKRKVEEAKNTLASVYSYIDLLAAVSTDSDQSELQIERTGELLRNVEQMLINLEHSTFIYMECRYEIKNAKDDAFGSDPGILCDIIAQALSENDCSLTDIKEEADFELTLITSTALRSDGTGDNAVLSYYANVKGSLYNRNTKRKTADFTILNDKDAYSTGRSPEDAASKAFRRPELKNMVMEKILPRIKN